MNDFGWKLLKMNDFDFGWKLLKLNDFAEMCLK
ncbi:hypothetical protein T03_9082 [Trichinella britovi]|uniref:Uncharacterized protein n=1 Tax=Trichinella britovi TaxID=45882 RepID=A0A0V1B5Y0_TRIBR|nr:hypothetical protein T03_9082 [Trichinella britovi]